MGMIRRVTDERRVLCEYPIQLVSGMLDEEVDNLIRICDELAQTKERNGRKPTRMPGWIAASLCDVRRQRQTPGAEPFIITLPKDMYADDVGEVGRALTELLLICQFCTTNNQSVFVSEILADLVTVSCFYLEAYEKERALFLARNPQIRDVEHEEEK